MRLAVKRLNNLSTLCADTLRKHDCAFMCWSSILTKMQPRQKQRLSLSNQTNSPQSVKYKVCGTTLESVTSQRDLGIIVTNTLSWSLHYGKLCQKAYNALHLIKRSLPESAPVYLKKKQFPCPLPPLLLFTSLETSICQRYLMHTKEDHIILWLFYWLQVKAPRTLIFD